MKGAFVAFCLVLIAAPAVAGVVYEVEVTDHEQSPPKTDEMEVAAEGRLIKIDILPGESGGGRGKVIYNGGRDQIVVVDDDEKTYYVVDKAALAGIAGQVSAAMKQVEEMLQNLSKEQQDAIRRARGGAMPGGPRHPPERAAREVRRTGERGTRAGYPCVKYEVLSEGRKIRELWVTDWSNVEGGSDVVDAFEDMADFFSELMESIPDFGGQGGPDAAYAETFGSGGFPVVTREFDEDGSLKGETKLRSARRRTLDPAAFEPPLGHKRQEMFGPPSP